MYQAYKLFFLIAETPIHPGSGSELGVVDLPVQREKHTGFPKIEGSGIKGCMREAFESSERTAKIGNDNVEVKKWVKLVFGPANGDEHAGCIAFTDARILFFPVKSLKGIFAWVTCPMVLERFKDDMKIAGIDMRDFPPIKKKTCPPGSQVSVKEKERNKILAVFEEFTFELTEDEETKKLACWFASRIFPQQETAMSYNPYNFWRKKLERDLIILENDDFEHFVSASTEIVARTVIDDVKGTAKNLWYEEYLPSDTILYSIAMVTPPRVERKEEKGPFGGSSPQDEAKRVIEYFEEGVPPIIQIGGNQTVGKGITRVQVLK